MSTLDSNNTIDNVEEEENEEESEDNMKEKVELDTKKSTPFMEEIKSQNYIKTNDELCTLKNIDAETDERNANIVDDKKRRKDKKLEKSKIMKKQYDQDVHSEDYSTWTPPQNQSGDGRTSLNDKYGY